MFRTELDVTKSEWDVNHTTPILTIGSCFSDQIGHLFSDNKFKILTNPFGTVYNPISLCRLLELSILDKGPTKDSYVENDGIHSNFHFHSSFSSVDEAEVADSIASTISNTRDYLTDTEFLIITLGTSLVYERIENGEIVSNCHKIPSKRFRKRLLDEEEILNSFNGLLKRLKSFNPGLKIILTVSPVRHLKDTMEQNAVSKSLLRLICHKLTQANSNIQYFPSYELVLDDLRDYRFYKSDMIHPNEVAEAYIWQKFQETFFSSKTVELVKKWGKLNSALQHHPFNPESIQHQKFLKDTIAKMQNLKPQLDVNREIEVLTNQLTS